MRIYIIFIRIAQIYEGKSRIIRVMVCVFGSRRITEDHGESRMKGWPLMAADD